MFRKIRCSQCGGIEVQQTSTDWIMEGKEIDKAECYYCGWRGLTLECLAEEGKMTWGYKVLSRQVGDSRFLAVYEVFYDENGKIWSCTEKPVYPSGETIEELKDELIEYLFVTTGDVMDYDDIPQEGAINPTNEVIIQWEE